VEIDETRHQHEPIAGHHDRLRRRFGTSGDRDDEPTLVHHDVARDGIGTGPVEDGGAAYDERPHRMLTRSSRERP
jgi:hypothetical protein